MPDELLQCLGCMIWIQEWCSLPGHWDDDSCVHWTFWKGNNELRGLTSCSEKLCMIGLQEQCRDLDMALHIKCTLCTSTCNGVKRL